jgi:hypothetical protein
MSFAVIGDPLFFGGWINCAIMRTINRPIRIFLSIYEILNEGID